MQTNNRQHYISFLNKFCCFLYLSKVVTINWVKQCKFLYPPLNVISRLLLSKSAGPKVIIISGFHCMCVCIYIYIYIYTHTHTHTHTHICVCVCVRACVRASQVLTSQWRMLQLWNQQQMKIEVGWNPEWHLSVEVLKLATANDCRIYCTSI